MEKIINIAEFEQGNVGSSGNYDSDYRIRTTGYIRENPLKSVKISAASSTGKALQIELYGYVNNTTTSYIFDKYWYDLPYEFDLSSYTNLKFLRIVFKYKDGTKITPDELSECTVTEYFDWYADSTGIHCEGMPEASEKAIYSPFPLSLWRMSGDVPTHELYPEAPEKAVKKPYPLSLWRIDYISPEMPYHRLFPNIKGINMWSLPRENVIRVYDYREPQDGFKHNGLAILAPSECTEYHELNGRWDVNLTHPVDDWGRWKFLLPQNVLKIDGQLFRIDEHTSVSGTSGMYIQVHAKHISYDLADEFVHYYQGENLNGSDYIRAMFGACLTDLDHYNKYNFQYSSDLESRTGLVEINNQTLLNAFIGNDNCLINLLGGELYRNNFYFSINKRMEGAKDNAFALKYGFDMTGITQKIDYSELTTWLMVDNNFGDNWSVSYVNDVYPIHHHKHMFRHFNYSDSADSYDHLVRDGQELFGQLCRPKVSYEVNIANLKKDPKYSGFIDLQNYRLGDKGTIECELLDIKTTQEIIAVQTDRLTGEIKKIKLGSENYSLVRPSYKSGTISAGASPAENALQKQLEELEFREYITFPITTADGKYLTTENNKYLTYKE